MPHNMPVISRQTLFYQTIIAHFYTAITVSLWDSQKTSLVSKGVCTFCRFFFFWLSKSHVYLEKETGFVAMLSNRLRSFAKPASSVANALASKEQLEHGSSTAMKFCPR